jgi:acyl-ACP thioesterase
VTPVPAHETTSAMAILDESLLISRPTTGRVYAHRRRVQLADASPNGRLRFDAIARYLQDVSDEDTCEVGFDPAAPWVVRRVLVHVASFPSFRDTVDVATWCSGVGSRWAERRVSIRSPAAVVEAAVLWVHLDERGRPARLPPLFDEIYTPVAQGRTVRARLKHSPLPVDATRTPFPLRFTDCDLMDHVNNAIAWVPVEATLARRRDLRAPLVVSVEHPAPIASGASVDVVTVDTDDGFDLWIVDGDKVCASAQVRRA